MNCHAVEPGKLYPQIEPFDKRFLNVGDGHRIFCEQCGTPDGVPVVVLHGGPGGGCSPSMRRFFDPQSYRVVLFDQRGCGRSRPHASVEANSTWHLVDDIERIRESLGIDKWIVFGGSWGAALGLIYAQRHAQHVAALVLRGVFTMTQTELDWFYGGGAGRFYPEQWQIFESLVPEDERGDLIAAYGRRLFGGCGSELSTFARAWFDWENTASTLQDHGPSNAPSDAYVQAFARIENHYFVNRGFLDRDDWIMTGMDEIRDVPGQIIHGRYDMICPPVTAYRLASHWPAASLKFVEAGHALSEPAISSEVLKVTNALRSRFSELGF